MKRASHLDLLFWKLTQFQVSNELCLNSDKCSEPPVSFALLFGKQDHLYLLSLLKIVVIPVPPQKLSKSLCLLEFWRKLVIFVQAPQLKSTPSILETLDRRRYLGCGGTDQHLNKQHSILNLAASQLLCLS